MSSEFSLFELCFWLFDELLLLRNWWELNFISLDLFSLFLDFSVLPYLWFSVLPYLCFSVLLYLLLGNVLHLLDLFDGWAWNWFLLFGYQFHPTVLKFILLVFYSFFPDFINLIVLLVDGLSFMLFSLLNTFIRFIFVGLSMSKCIVEGLPINWHIVAWMWVNVVCFHVVTVYDPISNTCCVITPIILKTLPPKIFSEPSVW